MYFRAQSYDKSVLEQTDSPMGSVFRSARLGGAGALGAKHPPAEKGSDSERFCLQNNLLDNKGSELDRLLSITFY